MMDQEDFTKMLALLPILRMREEMDHMAQWGFYLLPPQSEQVWALIQEIPSYGGSPREFARAYDTHRSEIETLKKEFPAWLQAFEHSERSSARLRDNIGHELNTLLVGSEEQVARVYGKMNELGEIANRRRPEWTTHIVWVDAQGLNHESPNSWRDLLGRVAHSLGVELDVSDNHVPRDSYAYLAVLHQIRRALRNWGEEVGFDGPRAAWPAQYTVIVTHLEPQLGGNLFCNLRDELWNVPGITWVTDVTPAHRRFILRHPSDFFDQEIDLTTGVCATMPYIAARGAS